MDGSPADGQYTAVELLILLILVRSRRARGTDPNRPPSKKDGQKRWREEVRTQKVRREEVHPEKIRQKVEQESRKEIGQEGQPQIRPEIFGQKVDSKECPEISQEECAAQRQARQVQPERWPAALGFDQLFASSAAMAAAQLISAMWVKAWGKLPRKAPVAGSISSE